VAGAGSLRGGGISACVLSLSVQHGAACALHVQAPQQDFCRFTGTICRHVELVASDDGRYAHSEKCVVTHTHECCVKASHLRVCVSKVFMSPNHTALQDHVSWMKHTLYISTLLSSETAVSLSPNSVHTVHEYARWLFWLGLLLLADIMFVCEAFSSVLLRTVVHDNQVPNLKQTCFTVRLDISPCTREMKPAQILPTCCETGLNVRCFTHDVCIVRLYNTELDPKCNSSQVLYKPCVFEAEDAFSPTDKAHVANFPIESCVSPMYVRGKLCTPCVPNNCCSVCHGHQAPCFFMARRRAACASLLLL